MAVLNLLDARIAASYTALSQAQIGQYVQLLAEIEGSLFVVSELAKTVSSEELVQFFNVIDLIEKLPTEYVALRLISTEFIIAVAPLLNKQEVNQKLVVGLLWYTLRGFTDVKLTLGISSYCFMMLCKENAILIAPFALELVKQILVEPFLAKWGTGDEFADIMRGMGYLIPFACQ